MLTSLFFRAAHAFQVHPWLRVFLGLLLIALGVVGVVLGAGHGGLIAFGIVALLGGAAAIRGRGGGGGNGDKLR